MLVNLTMPWDRLFENDVYEHCSRNIFEGTFGSASQCPYTVIIEPPSKLILVPERPTTICTTGTSPKKETTNSGKILNVSIQP
jgi:hypothetical protein